MSETAPPNPSYANPFGPLRADSLGPLEVTQLFIDHAKCAPIQGPGHHLVVGPSGTGKTMAFRYLALRDRLAADQASGLPRFIGVYVSLKSDAEIWRKRLEDADLTIAARLYEAYVGHVIGHEILSALSDCDERGIWGIRESRATLLRLAASVYGYHDRTVSYSTLLGHMSDVCNRIVKAVNTAERLPAVDSFSRDASIHLAIPRLCGDASEQVTSLRSAGTTFYLFLDYYDELLPWQQRAVNSVVKRPSTGYYVKLGARPYGVYDIHGPSGTSMLEELEGRVHLLYFRNELQQFKSFLAGIVARRVANKTEDPEAMLRLLLPEGDPMETAREVVGGQAAGQRGLFDQALGLDRCGVHEQIATLARTDEDRGKLAACAYLGFDGLCSLADGNVGIFMDICHRAWENARLLDTWSGKTGARIAPLCQVQAAASFAAERNKDIEIGSPEGPHVMNFVDEVCHELKKRPGLQQERNYDSWNVQLEEPIELSEHTVRALQAGFQHRVFVPRSIEGFDALPQRLNVCGFLLLHRGVVDLARPPLEVSPGDANNWMRHLPREMTRPPVNIRPSAPPQKVAHKGFLSVSFRKEEPASMVRARLLDIFGRTDPTIRCCDATAFGAYGSPRLLEKVRSYVDREATFCLVEVSNITPNTMLELGLATGLNRRFWTLSSLDRVGALPDWIGGLAIVLYALDKNKPQHFLDTVVHNQIVSPLSGITKRTFCPHWRNLTWCPYKISKDPNVVHISFPEGDNLWSLVTDRLRHDRTLREFRLTTDSDIGPALPGTPDAVCVRCYAVRNAGTVFVATTPPSGPVTFDAQTDGPRHDPLQCFVLGMAFALRRNCHHLYEDGRGGQLTMWKGYPVFSWKTAEEAHDYALRTLQALLRTRKRNDPRILPEQKE